MPCKGQEQGGNTRENEGCGSIRRGAGCHLKPFVCLQEDRAEFIVQLLDVHGSGYVSTSDLFPVVEASLHANGIEVPAAEVQLALGSLSAQLSGSSEKSNDQIATSKVIHT